MKRLGLVAILFAPAMAHAWDPFLSANSNVEDGNAHLKRHDAKQAIEAYERAARELPSEAGVHLDRGLALLEQSKLDQARQAFSMAAESTSAPRNMRANAYHNLGVVFYKQADAAAAENRHQEAQTLFREASDSFRRALRSQPGQRSSAWNLELSRRRIADEAEKQKKEEKDQQQQQSQQQDQNQNNSNNPNDSPQEDSGQKKPQDSNNQDRPEQKPESSPSKQPSSDSQNKKPPEDQGNKQDSQRGEEDESNPSPSESQLPSSAARVLDALQAGEENLERQQARMRAQREHRKTTKDW